MDTYIMLFFKRHYSEIYNKNTIMVIALYRCFQIISVYFQRTSKTLHEDGLRV